MTEKEPSYKPGDQLRSAIGPKGAGSSTPTHLKSYRKKTQGRRLEAKNIVQDGGMERHRIGTTFLE